MCGPALLSLLALALSLVLRSEKALATSTGGLASGVATKMCDFGTALDNAAGEARAVTEKLALRREKAGRNLGALTAALEASAAILNDSKEAATLRSQSTAKQMAQRARDAITGMTRIMDATMQAGDAASKAAAGVKEYMRVLGTVAGKSTDAVTCLDTAASLTAGNTTVGAKLAEACAHFFGTGPKNATRDFDAVIKKLQEQGTDKIITDSSGGVGGSGATPTTGFGTAASSPNNKCNLFNIAGGSQAGIGVSLGENVTYADTIELQFHATNGKMTLLGKTGTLEHNQSVASLIETLQLANNIAAAGGKKADLCQVDRIDICNDTEAVSAVAQKLIADAVKKGDEALTQAQHTLNAQEEEHDNEDAQAGAAATHKKRPGTRGDLEAPKAGESHTQTPASFAHQHKLSQTTLFSLFASLCANA